MAKEATFHQKSWDTSCTQIVFPALVKKFREKDAAIIHSGTFLLSGQEAISTIAFEPHVAGGKGTELRFGKRHNTFSTRRNGQATMISSASVFSQGELEHEIHTQKKYI